MPALFTSLRHRLLLLVAAVTLPIVLFVSFALWQCAEEQRASVERALVDKARAMSAAVDNDLLSIVAVGQAIAQSASIDEGDFRSLYALARRVSSQQEGWLSVALAHTDGRQIFNLLRPFGEPLPPTADVESVEAAARNVKAVIGDLFPGNVARGQLFPVRVPVVRDGQVRYVLSVGVRPDAMLTVLRAHEDRTTPY